MLEFPFERERFYPVGKLHVFCAAVRDFWLQNKHADVNLRDWHWDKLYEEELVPFSLTVNQLGAPPTAEFAICKEANSGPDILFRDGKNEVGFQVTVADPNWNSNGGYTHSLTLEALATHGYADGLGGTTRVDGKLVTESKAVWKDDIEHVCRDGLIGGLEKKLKSGFKGDALIVYTRGYFMLSGEDEYRALLEPIVQDLCQKYRSSKPIFLVGHGHDEKTLFCCAKQPTNGLKFA